MLEAVCVPLPVPIALGRIAQDCVPRVLGDINGDCECDLSDALAVKSTSRVRTRVKLTTRISPSSPIDSVMRMDFTLDHLNPEYDKTLGG